MRRKKKKINIIFLICVLFFLVVGVSYAYLSTTLQLSGIVRGKYTNNEIVIDPRGDSTLNITSPTIANWKEGNLYQYHYRFAINNTSDVDYDNYIVTLTFNHSITNVKTWNYNYKINGNQLIIINEKNILKAKKSLDVEFQVGSQTSDLKLIKVKLETNTETIPIDPTKLVVEFNKTTTWGSYVHQYNVVVTNKTGKDITYWQINVNLSSDARYMSGWNAIFEQKDGMLIIKNENYNGRVENNKSVTFGIQLESNLKDYIPSNYTVLIR